MTMKKRNLNRLPLLALLGWSAGALAGSTLEYEVRSGRKDRTQTIFVSNNQVLIQSAGGNRNRDLWYRGGEEQLALIDHKHRSFTLLTEASVGRIARQAEELQPVLRGIGEQLGKLSPKQKSRWEGMLGVDMDQADALRHPAEPASLAKTGGGKKKVAGIDCEPLVVMRGKATAAEVCLAKQAGLKLPAEDYATLRAMFAYAQRLTDKAQVLARFFHLPVPPAGELAGIPVEIRELSGAKPVVMTLTRIGLGAGGENRLGIPAGYESRDLKLW